MIKIKKHNEFISELSRNLIRDGIIKTENKTRKQIQNEIKEYLVNNLNAIEDFEISIDYRQGLLVSARHFVKNEDYYSAIVFYALWIEHWLNQIILVSLKRKKINEEYFKEIIRTSSVKSKCTWLWKLLELKPLYIAHRKIIDRLFEKRNAFIHYKWKSYDINETKMLIAQLIELKNFVLSIDKTVIYLRNYENKHVYKKLKMIFP